MSSNGNDKFGSTAAATARRAEQVAEEREAGASAENFLFSGSVFFKVFGRILRSV